MTLETTAVILVTVKYSAIHREYVLCWCRVVMAVVSVLASWGSLQSLFPNDQQLLPRVARKALTSPRRLNLIHSSPSTQDLIFVVYLILSSSLPSSHNFVSWHSIA